MSKLIAKKESWPLTEEEDEDYDGLNRSKTRHRFHARIELPDIVLVDKKHKKCGQMHLQEPVDDHLRSWKSKLHYFLFYFTF